MRGSGSAGGPAVVRLGVERALRGLVATLTLLAVGGPLAGWSQEGRLAAENPEPPVSLREEVLRSSAGHAFSVVSGGAPLVVFSRRDRQTTVTLRNDGQVTWEPGGTFALSYHWLDLGGELLQWEGHRTPVEESVGVGETTTLELRVASPWSPGLYRLQLDLLEEHVIWSSLVDPTPEPARLVLVLPPPGILVGCLAPCAMALIGLLAVLRSRSSPRWTPIADWADLLWCGAALIWKPRILYEELQLVSWGWMPWATLSVVALILLPMVWLPPRARAPVAWSAAAFASLYLWGDLLHYRFFGDLATSTTLLGAHQTGELGESIGYLAQPWDWALAPDLVLALPLVLAPWVGLGAARDRRLRPSRRLVAGVLALALIPGAVRVWQETTRETGRKRRTRPPIEATARNGIWAFQLQDFTNQARRSWIRQTLADEELARLVRWFEQRAGDRRGPSPWVAPLPGKNLLLIQVESLQSFVLGFRWQDQAVTPNLERLASRALVFPNFQDQTSRGRSSDADFAVFSSLLPVADSVAYQYAGNEHVTLVAALREMGYSTLSAVPFKPAFWNRRVTHPAYGFEETLFQDDFELREKIGWGLNDQDFFRQMLPRLAAQPRPFCAWLTTLSVHYPYQSFPERHKVLDLGPWEGTSLGNYLHGMSFFDRALGELWDGLEASGLLAETVVVLWGDHDSTLHLRNEFAAPLGIRSRVPGRFLADRVPFMIWLPGAEARFGEVALRSGHVDIAPTLLSLVGGDAGPLPWMGRNLLADPSPAPVVHPRGNWVDADHAYLNLGGGSGEGECWDHRRWERVAVSECARGQAAATEQLEVAEQVLRYDLQRRIGKALGGSVSE